MGQITLPVRCVILPLKRSTARCFLFLTDSASAGRYHAEHACYFIRHECWVRDMQSDTVGKRVHFTSLLESDKFRKKAEPTLQKARTLAFSFLALIYLVHDPHLNPPA